MAAPAITLTTDFGTRDPYVAQMKGVLLGGAPGSPLVDLSHELPPHDIAAGALFLAAAVPRFPAGTLHLAVVDPGVGSARRAVAARLEDGQLIICPDNGLLTLLLEQGAVEVRAIEHHGARPAAPAPTFHGRDLFAPAAAALASGRVAFEALGPRVDDPVRLDLPAPEALPGRALRGVVLSVDRFGNAITNLALPPGEPWRARAAGHDLGPLRRTYADVPRGTALALLGSAGTVEIAVREGSAATVLGLRPGDAVEVEPL